MVAEDVTATSTLSPIQHHPHQGILWPLAGPTLWLAIPLVAIAYSGVAAISLALALPPGYASAVWPPAGIALAAWIAFGPRVWPAVLIGAAIANLGVTGTPASVALAIGAGNATEAAAAGWLLQRWIAPGHCFEQPADVWKFAAVAFATAMIAATNGVWTLALAGAVPWAEFGRHWLTWWLGDATGMVIVAPLLLAWSAPVVSPAPGRRRTEYQLFAAMLGLFAVFAWSTNYPSDTVQKIAYVTIPLVAWAAGRLDQRAVTAASFVISAVAVLDMLDGESTIFDLVPVNQSLLLLQLFMSAVALTGLTLSAFAGQLARANAQLKAAYAELERRAASLPDTRQSPDGSVRDPLTATEREIVRLIAGGMSNVEAARVLGLSPRTVETYRARLMEKLHVDHLPALVKYAIQRGLTSIE